MATPLFLLVAAIGLADVVFAFDSIPAVFGITTSASLVVACNVFALMGLRQLYVLLVRTLDRIRYLHVGLAVICAFIGVKLLLEALDSSGVGLGGEHPGLDFGDRGRRRAADHRGRGPGGQAGRTAPSRAAAPPPGEPASAGSRS